MCACFGPHTLPLPAEVPFNTGKAALFAWKRNNLYLTSDVT